jgi:hypothetical protein
VEDRTMLNTQWRTWLWGQDVIILPFTEADEVQRRFAQSPERAAWSIDEWFPNWHRDSGGTRTRLMDVCRSLNISLGGHPDQIDTRVLRELVQAELREGRLLVVPFEIKGAFRVLVPFGPGVVANLPKQRGMYVFYQYDRPFYVGWSVKSMYTSLVLHLPGKRHQLKENDRRTLLFDYYCPVMIQETVQDIVRRLHQPTYGELRLHPDPDRPPPRCNEEGCECPNYNDAAFGGLAKIRLIAQGHARCKCGHDHAAHG